jgi:hypothetical protein
LLRLGPKGFWGRIGVEKIGIARDDTRGRSGHQTEFKYKRGVQRLPKLATWVDVLMETLEQEDKLPKRERRSTQRLFDELLRRRSDGAHNRVHRFVNAWRNEDVEVPVYAYVPMSFLSRGASSLSGATRR